MSKIDGRRTNWQTATLPSRGTALEHDMNFRLRSQYRLSLTVADTRYVRYRRARLLSHKSDCRRSISRWRSPGGDLQVVLQPPRTSIPPPPRPSRCAVSGLHLAADLLPRPRLRRRCARRRHTHELIAAGPLLNAGLSGKRLAESYFFFAAASQRSSLSRAAGGVSTSRGDVGSD